MALIRQQYTKIESIPNDFYLEVEKGWLSVIIPNDKTNFVRNPKILLADEDPLTAFSYAWDMTLVQNTDDGPSGNGYVSAVAIAGERLTYRTLETALANVSYSFSVAMRSDDPNCQVVLALTENNLVPIGSEKTVTLTNTWKRFSITRTSTLDEAGFGVVVEAVDDCNFDIADFQIEQGNVSTYFDGDTFPGTGESQDVYGWNGLPNQSNSYRQDTYTGGTVFNLKDEVGFRIIGIEGLLGIPEMDVSLTPLITGDRSLFRCSTLKEREFSIVGRVHSCNDFCELLCKHNALAASLFTQDRPIRLRFELTECEGCPSVCVEFDAFLQANEVEVVNPLVSEVQLDFIQADPSIRQCNINSVTIDAESTQADETNTVFVGIDGQVDPLTAYAPNPPFTPILQNGVYNSLNKQLFMIWDGVTGDGLNNGGRVTQFNGTTHLPIGGLYGGSSTNRARAIASRGRYVVVGGNFTSIEGGSGTACNAVVDAPTGCTGQNIGLYDVLTNTWFNIGSFTQFINEGVNSLVWISDTEIAVGGSFGTYTPVAGAAIPVENIAILDISTLALPTVSTLGNNNELVTAVNGVIDMAYCETNGQLAVASDAFDDVGPTLAYNLMFYDTIFDNWDISQDYSLGYTNVGPNQGDITSVKFTSNCDLLAAGVFIGNGAVIPFEDNYEGIAILRNNGLAGYEFPTHVAGWSIDTSLTPGAGAMEIVECHGSCYVVGDNMIVYYTRLDGAPFDPIAMCGGFKLTPRNLQWTQVDATRLTFSPVAVETIAACDITTIIENKAPNNMGCLFGISSATGASVNTTTGDVILCSGNITHAPVVEIYGEGYIFDITNSANGSKLILNRQLQDSEVLTIDLLSGRQRVISSFTGEVQLDVGSSLTGFVLEEGVNTIIPLWDVNTINDDARVVVKHQQQSFGLQIACSLCPDTVDLGTTSSIADSFSPIIESDTPLEEQPDVPTPL